MADLHRGQPRLADLKRRWPTSTEVRRARRMSSARRACAEADHGWPPVCGCFGRRECCSRHLHRGRSLARPLSKELEPFLAFKERGILRTQPLVRILLTKLEAFLEEYEPFGSGALPVLSKTRAVRRCHRGKKSRQQKRQRPTGTRATAVLSQNNGHHNLITISLFES